MQAVLPNTKKVRRIMYENADKVVDQIKEAFSHSRKVALTCDIWSNKLITNSFLGVTAHLFNQNVKRRQAFRIGTYRVK